MQATGTVYPGVEVRMGPRLLAVNAARPATRFRWNPAARNIETE